MNMIGRTYDITSHITTFAVDAKSIQLLPFGSPLKPKGLTAIRGDPEFNIGDIRESLIDHTKKWAI